MPNEYNVNQALELALLVTVIGREARGESYDAMLAVGWSIRNRVMNPHWWGHDWFSVITKPEQYTSMVPPLKDKDPNLTVYPDITNPKWSLCVEAAEDVYWGINHDPTNGADHYYDRSMDDDPPYWTKDGSSEHVCDVGDLHFWKSH